MGDYPGYRCEICRYLGDPFTMIDVEKTECRRNSPSLDGFPYC